MKTLNMTTIAMVIALLIFSIDAIAQNRGTCAAIPGLSNDQKNAIEKLRTAHIDKVSKLHEQVTEKQGQLQELRTSENANMDRINAVIDEIAGLRAELMKERESHRQAIRSELDADQRAWFDSRQDRRQRPGNRAEFNRPADCRFSQNNQSPEGGRRFRHRR